MTCPAAPGLEVQPTEGDPKCVLRCAPLGQLSSVLTFALTFVITDVQIGIISLLHGRFRGR
jgi:hypothetical protein